MHAYIVYSKLQNGSTRWGIHETVQIESLVTSFDLVITLLIIIILPSVFYIINDIIKSVHNDSQF